MSGTSINSIPLPGGKKMIDFFLDKIDPKQKSVLISGPSSENIAAVFKSRSPERLEIVVEEYDSLMNSMLILKDQPDISVKTMDFEHTDYKDETFDLIFAQGSISNERRKGILKEFRRIIKPNGNLCAGEIVTLKKEPPVFIQNIFNDSGIVPVFIDEIPNYYTQKNFEILSMENISYTLKEYYSTVLKQLKDTLNELAANEKSFYKKLLNRMSHESQAYLKQGGDKYIGFVVLIAKPLK